MPILAFEGKFPLNETILGDMVKTAATSTNRDFTITSLVRILFLVGPTEWGQHYDQMILPTLRNQSYWFSTTNFGDYIATGVYF